MIKKLVFALTILSTATFSYGASPAFDNGSNYTTATWTNGSNAGSGFSAWALTSGGAGGRFIGTTGDGANSFGIFSGGNNPGDSSTADRSFTGGPLLAGQTFSLTLGADAVDATAPGVVGLNLLSSGSPIFTFKFTGGGTVWQLNDGGSDFGTSINFSSSTPITFSFTYNGGNSYNINISEAGSMSFVGNGFTATSNLSNITGFRFFSSAQGAGANLGFNNLQVVPEPSSLALLTGPAILGALLYIRRRRS